MKHLLLTAITAVVLVGCGNSEADRELFDAASYGNIINGTAAGGVIEAVKGFLAAGTDVNAKDAGGETTLYHAATKEIAELLIANGAGVNAKDEDGRTPLRGAQQGNR